MSLLQDTLNESLSTESVRIRVAQVFDAYTGWSTPTDNSDLERSKTPGRAKSLLDFYELVGTAIDDYEVRAGTPTGDKVNYVEEEPDTDSETEAITYSLVSRQPGAFSQGAPLEGRIKNQRPRFVEYGTDSTEPGYRFAIEAYWYDNVVRFTCWARSNKVANKRAEWFEDMMSEYNWVFKAQGVERVLFQGRQSDLTVIVDGNKWYGRPFDFFVRTQKIRTLREKTLEEIIIKLGVVFTP